MPEVLSSEVKPEVKLILCFPLYFAVHWIHLVIQML